MSNLDFKILIRLGLTHKLERKLHRDLVVVNTTKSIFECFAVNIFYTYPAVPVEVMVYVPCTAEIEKLFNMGR